MVDPIKTSTDQHAKFGRSVIPYVGGTQKVWAFVCFSLGRSFPRRRNLPPLDKVQCQIW